MCAKDGFQRRHGNGEFCWRKRVERIGYQTDGTRQQHQPPLAAARGRQLRPQTDACAGASLPGIPDHDEKKRSAAFASTCAKQACPVIDAGEAGSRDANTATSHTAAARVPSGTRVVSRLRYAS